MKPNPKEELLLRTMEDYLDQYRKRELDGTVMESVMVNLEGILDAFSIQKNLRLELEDDFPKA